MTQEKHKSQRSETKLTPESRIAFPFHHEKRTKSAGGRNLNKPRHDAVILVPKLSADPAQCPNYAMLAGMCMEAATKAWGSFPQGGKWPIQDGDVPYVSKPKPGVAPLTPEQVAQRNEWRKGSWLIEVSSNLDPGPRVCVMQNGVAVEIPAKIINGQQLYKSGDFGYVSLSAYTFHNETFGVNFGYEGVLYTRPGEAIGSSGPRSAAQMFGGVVGTAAPQGSAPPPLGAPQPQPGYAPPPMPPAMPGAAVQQQVAAAPPVAPQYAAAPPSAPVAPVAPVAQGYAPPPMPPGAPQYAAAPTAPGVLAPFPGQ